MFKDLHTIDLDEFKYGGTNITGFRLVNPDTPVVQKVLKQWVSRLFHFIVKHKN